MSRIRGREVAVLGVGLVAAIAVGWWWVQEIGGESGTVAADERAGVTAGEALREGVQSVEVEGLNVDLDAPSSAKAGEMVSIRVRVRDDRGVLEGPVMLDLGDGSGYVGGAFGRAQTEVAGDAVCDEIEGRAEEPGTTRVERSYQHAYRHPGSYVIRAVVGTGSGCGGEEVEAEAEEVTREIVIGGTRTATSNGPREPRVQIGKPYGIRGSNSVVIDVAGSDDDGFVRRLEVDWGDGTKPEVFGRGLDECESSGDTWPRSTYSTGEIHHQYKERGQYDVTVTATSVGCDGAYGQVATGSRRVSYPPAVKLPE